MSGVFSVLVVLAANGADPLALYRRATAHFDAEEYADASRDFTAYYEKTRSPNGLFMLGKTNFYWFKESKSAQVAREAYENLTEYITRFPKAEHVQEAREYRSKLPRFATQQPAAPVPPPRQRPDPEPAREPDPAPSQPPRPTPPDPEVVSKPVPSEPTRQPQQAEAPPPYVSGLTSGQKAGIAVGVTAGAVVVAGVVVSVIVASNPCLGASGLPCVRF